MVAQRDELRRRVLAQNEAFLAQQRQARAETAAAGKGKGKGGKGVKGAKGAPPPPPPPPPSEAAATAARGQRAYRGAGRRRRLSVTLHDHDEVSAENRSAVPADALGRWVAGDLRRQAAAADASSGGAGRRRRRRDEARHNLHGEISVIT
jgi:hypothetical protein